MRTSTRSPKPLAAIAGLALCAALVACGPDSTADDGPPQIATALVGDCSRSFAEQLPRALPGMLDVARAVAAERGRLSYFCADGSPIRTARIASLSFRDAPEAVAGDEGLLDRFNQARAAGLRPALKQMIATPPRTRGSGLLEAIEVASELPAVRRIVFFTDGLLNEPEDGFDLASASATEAEALAGRWSRRLSLDGVEVELLGFGLGARSTRQVRTAESLFAALARRTGARLTMTTALAPGQT